MDKSQKEIILSVISKALDEGAKIDVNFHGLRRKEARQKIEQVAGELEVLFTQEVCEGSNWFHVRSDRQETLEVAAFYNE